MLLLIALTHDEVFCESKLINAGCKILLLNKLLLNFCQLAYEWLDKNERLHTIRNELENPNRDEAIGQLEILARRGYFTLRTYEFEQEHDENGNPIWTAKCYVEEAEYYFDATSSSKKEAKKDAAFEMLKYVLEEF